MSAAVACASPARSPSPRPSNGRYSRAHLPLSRSHLPGGPTSLRRSHSTANALHRYQPYSVRLTTSTLPSTTTTTTSTTTFNSSPHSASPTGQLHHHHHHHHHHIHGPQHHYIHLEQRASTPSHHPLHAGGTLGLNGPVHNHWETGQHVAFSPAVGFEHYGQPQISVSQPTIASHVDHGQGHVAGDQHQLTFAPPYANVSNAPLPYHGDQPPPIFPAWPPMTLAYGQRGPEMQISPLLITSYQGSPAYDASSALYGPFPADWEVANGPQTIYGTSSGLTTAIFDHQPLHLYSPVGGGVTNNSFLPPTSNMGGGPSYPPNAVHGHQVTNTWDDNSSGQRQLLQLEASADDGPSVGVSRTVSTSAPKTELHVPSLVNLGESHDSQRTSSAKVVIDEVEDDHDQPPTQLKLEDDDGGEDDDIKSSNNTRYSSHPSAYLSGPAESREPPKKRGAFQDEKLRKATAETRKRKACVRCRHQKMRCEFDPSDPDGDCLACKLFDRESKKTLHKMRCLRTKLTDSVLFRQGGLNLTARWTGVEMKDVGDRIDPGDVRTIYFTLGLCDKWLKARVVKFRPQPGDITARHWTVHENGREVKRSKPLAAYCLESINETARYFEEYVKENAIPAFAQCRIPSIPQPHTETGENDIEDNVIERTYRALLEHYYKIRESATKAKQSKTELAERLLLDSFFVLWFAMRHTTGSSWICGDEKLGMEPEMVDITYPLLGKVAVPRMLIAQFDSIINQLLIRYRKHVLQKLEELMQQSSPQFFFTIYACNFILLHEASRVSKDRSRHARENHGKTVRYSLPDFVQELQKSCNSFLYHWHYYNCKPFPDPMSPWDRNKSMLVDLTEDQFKLVCEMMMNPHTQRHMAIWEEDGEDNDRVDAPLREEPVAHYDWDHPFYWISQMFVPSWTPLPTFKAGSNSEGSGQAPAMES